MTTMTAHRIPTLSSRLLGLPALALTLFLLVGPAEAEPLDVYTGYTRPGNGEKAKLNQGQVEGEDIGVTVYYKVYRLPDFLRSDTTFTGSKDFEQTFVPGKDPSGRVSSPKLDTRARYLYLYQVVNDSGRKGIVRTVNVQLLVPPERITSWGHFVLKAENEQTRGLSFAVELPDRNAKDRSVIWPVSSEHNPVRAEQAAYRNPAPYEPRPELAYDLYPILLNNIRGLKQESEAVGREPDRVMLVTDPGFKPRRLPQPTAELANVAPSPLFPAGPVADTTGRAPFVGPGGFLQVNPAAFQPVSAVTEDIPSSNLVFRAVFEDPLRENQRSTVFGFTSDLPPVYVPVRVRGTTRDRLVTSGPDRSTLDARSDTLIADGGVPTPVAPAAEPISSPAPGGNLGGFIGVSGPGGGGFPGGGGGFPGGGGGFPGGGGGVPGGGGGGIPGGGITGSGSTANTTPSNQQQQQTTTPATNQQQQQGTTPTAPTTITITNTNDLLALAEQSQQQSQQQQQQQKQQQQQHQNQHQGQHQNNNHGHKAHQVVPEPAAALSALLGLPLLWLLRSRRRTRPEEGS